MSTEESSRFLFLVFLRASVRNPHGSEIFKEKSRFLTEHTEAKAHAIPSGKGEGRERAPRAETRRSEKGRARAENAQTASNDGNDGARCFSCAENEERRCDCGP